MKITLKFLKEKDACDEGLNWYRKQESKEVMDLLKALIKQKQHVWAEWLMRNAFNPDQFIRYRDYDSKLLRTTIYSHAYIRDLVMQYGLSLIKEGIHENNFGLS